MRAESVRKRGRSAIARRTGALIACLVWIAGFEIAPLMHGFEHAGVALHHFDLAGELRALLGVDLGLFEHERTDERHAHDHGAPDRRHGDGTLEHRSIAAASPGVALPPIDPPCIAELAPERAIAHGYESRIPSRERARGPPA
jgi:hypothetical protein